MKKYFYITLLFILFPTISQASFEQYPDLEYGSTNSVVSEIQKFLNTNGYTVNTIIGEPGSIGNESDYFGKLTQKSLSQFQKDHKITPSNGYFGIKTKEAFNSQSIIALDKTEEAEYAGEEDEIVNRTGQTNVQTAQSEIKPSTNPNSTVKSAVPTLTSKWTRYIDNKYFDTLYNQRYPYGTQITYQLTDWDFINKNGFFLGWSGPANTVPGGEGYAAKTLSFTLLGNTEVSTHYQNCAELSPDHVFFSNTSQLERKLMQFAQNKGDSKLRINAKGEVFAYVVEYSDGAICTKFIDMPAGGGGVSREFVSSFFEAYKGKSIKKMYQYHTHDFNSGKEISTIKEGKILLTYKNGNYYNPIPSDIDLLGSVLLKINQYNKILGLGDPIERVVSADGTVYEYDQSASKKAKNMLNDNDVFMEFSGKGLQTAIDAADKSKNADKRKEYTNKDALAAQQALLSFYKKELGTTYSTYTIK